MRMLVTLEFADAGGKSGSHSVLIIGRGSKDLQSGDIGVPSRLGFDRLHRVGRSFIHRWTYPQRRRR
jgi:hypothetical protein